MNNQEDKLTWIDYLNMVFIFLLASFLFVFLCFWAKLGSDGIIDEINHHLMMDSME